MRVIMVGIVVVCCGVISWISSMLLLVTELVNAARAVVASHGVVVVGRIVVGESQRAVSGIQEGILVMGKFFSCAGKSVGLLALRFGKIGVLFHVGWVRVVVGFSKVEETEIGG